MARQVLDFGFEIERSKRGERHVLVAGVDEAGRGPLAGPVVAAVASYRHADFAVSDELAKDFELIRDSKTLSEKQREKIFSLVQEHFYYGLGIIHAETIDRINILEATFLAMKEAIGEWRRKVRVTDGVDDQNILLLVDGNQRIPNLSLAQEAVVGGDRRVKSIAAASVLAKVTRDRMLVEYDAKWPLYGFAKHKGYGTREHMEALERFGPLPIHRQSFGPVKQAAIRFRELGITR